MEPPAAGTAPGPASVGIGGPEKYRNNGSAAFSGGKQCGMIVQSQVVAEPDKNGGRVFRHGEYFRCFQGSCNPEMRYSIIPIQKIIGQEEGFLYVAVIAIVFLTFTDR